nr:PREDICTED: solute carrier organic anion transporter family member 2B1 [Megachile rotundata]
MRLAIGHGYSATSQSFVDKNKHGVKYSPVCHVTSKTTFFSACHAGCRTIINDKEFGNCSCLPLSSSNLVFDHDTVQPLVQDQLIHSNNLRTMNYDKVRAGICSNDCSGPYLLFTVLSCIIQTLACSGKIGNVLVNYRSVDKKDKSFAQGVTLMTISLFALIPGPIIYGVIIDSTCLIWEESC